jgi:ATP-dependent DNA helicase RecG
MEKAAKRPVWAEGLNERQVEAVLYVGEHRRITNQEYQNLCRVSRETAKRDLRELVDRGLLRSAGRGRGLHYVLTQL